MSTLIKILLGLIIVAGASVFGIYYYTFHAGDDTPLEQLVPNDAIAYADITHVRKAALNLATSDELKVYTEFAKIFGGATAAIAASPSMQNATLPTPDWGQLATLGTSFNRQVSVALLPSKSEFPSLPTPVLLAHFQGDSGDFNATLEEFTGSLNDQLPDTEHLSWTTREHEGETIRILQFPNPNIAASGLDSQVAVPELKPAYAIIGQRFYASINPESLIEYLNTTKSMTVEPSMAMDTKFSRIRELPETQDSVFYLDFAKMMDSAVEFAQTAAAQNPAASQVSIETVFKTLGLLEIESIYGSLGMFSGSNESVQGMFYKNPVGLIDLVPQNGDFATPSFVPDYAFNANNLAFDVGELILLIKDTALNSIPLATMVYAQGKMQADQMVGQDFEAFLRDAFTDELHYIYSFEKFEIPTDGSVPPPPISQCFGIGLSDGESFNTVLQRLLAPMALQGMGFQTETVGNYELNIVQGMPNKSGAEIGYAIADNRILVGVGSLDTTRSTLKLISGVGKGAYQADDVAETIKDLPEGGFAYSFSDVGKLAAFMSDTIKMAFEQDMGMDEEELRMLEVIDWEALQNLDLKILAKSYHTPGHIETRYRMVK